MLKYEVVHDGGWRILTHHSATWVERSAALPTAAEAFAVVQALKDRQGRPDDQARADDAPLYLVYAGHYGWRPGAEASYVAWKWTGQNMADAVSVLAEFQQFDVDFCALTFAYAT